jgi:hypothetical protein
MDNGICYFVLMPLDVLNYIAHVLMWESHEEFIERIRVEKPIPQQYFTWFVPGQGCIAGSDDLKKSVKGVFCPDNTKIALFDLFCGECTEPKLMIIDAQKEKRAEAILYEGKLDNRSYRAIGLSRRGTMIAVIQKQTINNNKYSGVMDTLVIHKVALLRELALSKKEKSAEDKKDAIIEQKKESLRFLIPHDFIPTDINFNKQGTCVAVHGNTMKSMFALCKKTMIFSLKDKIDGFTLKDTIEAKDNLLQEYFRHKCICKNILRITPQHDL